MLVHVYVEVCEHVCMEAAGHYQVSSSINLLFCFGFEQGLPLNLVLTKVSELAASEPQVLPVSWPFSWTEVRDMYHHHMAFKWVLDFWIQVFVLVCKDFTNWAIFSAFKEFASLK